MSDGHFGDRLLEAIEKKRSHVVVGLDPEYGSLPPELLSAHPLERYVDETEMKVACYREFLSELLPALCARGRRREDPDRLFRGPRGTGLRAVRGDGRAGKESRAPCHRRRQTWRYRQHCGSLRAGPPRCGRRGRRDRQPLLRQRRFGAVLPPLPGGAARAFLSWSRRRTPVPPRSRMWCSTPGNRCTLE